MRPLSLHDLTMMAGAAASAAHLTPTHRVHTTTIAIGDTEVKATVSVRAVVVKEQGPNLYCDALGISVPSLASVRDHKEANTYALLIVALLECGGPLTLEEAAIRFEIAGIDDVDSALQSLKRCRPGRPPIYRDGDHYALDARDAEADLWAFRLGLRPPKVALSEAPPPSPRPTSDTPLTVAELDEGWRGAGLTGWSAQRIALAVLDAHDRPMSPDEVVAFVSARTQWHRLAANTTAFQRRSSAVEIDREGRWAIVEGARARDGPRCGA